MIIITPEIVPLSQFTLQWQITDECSRKYPNCDNSSSKKKYPSMEKMSYVISQYLSLIDSLRKFNSRMPAHIHITGGEPLMHPQFDRLLDELFLYRKYFSFGLFTDGSLITKENASRLKKSGCRFVQLNLDGSRKVNDRIRGKGSFDAVLNAVRILRKTGIQTRIVFTASRLNKNEFSSNFVSSCGADIVCSGRFVPHSRQKSAVSEILSPSETKEFFDAVRNSRSKFAFPFLRRTAVKMKHALQFLSGGGSVYECSAGKTLLTVMSSGDVYPCRELPVRAGNCFHDTLEYIYRKSSILRDLRISKTSDPECVRCPHHNTCGGGLRCLSYAVYDDWTKKDPGCWMQF